MFDNEAKQLEGTERSVPIVQTGVPAVKPPPSPTSTPTLAIGPQETNIKIDQL